MRLFLPLLMLAVVQVATASGAGDDPLRRPALGTYDVVVLRVEFQPDTTRFTTGTGTFDGDLYGGLVPKIDPLPHDAQYFEAHLSFLRDYVQRVSDGKSGVRTHLIPEVVQVSQPMGAYAPTGTDSNAPAALAKLAALIDEAWTLADQQTSFSMAGFDPERTAFLIFHAGVGRDVELTGTTLDRTPEDLPSLFFSSTMLSSLLQDNLPSFKGFTVDQTMVLPRTETRRGMNFITEQPFLAEISINGMLAASYFNYLGVPDLFDTASGQSAIGPFGLMDPLGIFAFAGLFPPEPSGWTRYFLGWADPIEISGSDQAEISLRASSLPEVSDLARVRISETEYFLIENRHRDPQGDDLRLIVQKEGGLEEQTYRHGQVDFNAHNVSGFGGGVVVAADNYDWALPGGLDEDDVELVGGMLIWHIDERVIEDRLPENAINSDPSRRGIDLEEADSAQDLGRPSDNPFAPQADLGSPFDFWYRGNPVRVLNQIGREIVLYQNRFGPDTFPNSNTNDGGSSFVVLEDFSTPGTDMSFTYRLETDERIHPLTLPQSAVLYDVLTERGQQPQTVSVWSLGEWLVADVDVGNGRWLSSVFDAEGAFAVIESLTPSSRLDDEVVWTETSPGGDLQFGVLDPVTGEVVKVPISGSTRETPVGPVVVAGERGDRRAFLLTESGGVASLHVMNRRAHLSSTTVFDVGQPLGMAAASDPEGANSTVVVFGRAGARAVDGSNAWTFTLSADARVGAPRFGSDQSGALGVVPVTNENRLLILGPDGAVDEVRLAADASAEAPALADVSGDGNLDILIPADSLLYGYLRSGALTPGFPISLRGGGARAPVVAERHDDLVFFVPLATGAVDGFRRVRASLGDANAAYQRLPGFPLPVGVEVLSVSVDEHLFAAPASGRLYGWAIEDLSKPLWSDQFGGSQRTAWARAGETVDEPAAGERLLVVRETYNWPNPVREGQTQLRCMTTEDSEVVVRIVDGAGRFVEEVTVGRVRAGIPTEAIWETNAGSGLYFARVTARSVSGREDSKVVKIAVIR